MTGGCHSRQLCSDLRVTSLQVGHILPSDPAASGKEVSTQDLLKHIYSCRHCPVILNSILVLYLLPSSEQKFLEGRDPSIFQFCITLA